MTRFTAWRGGVGLSFMTALAIAAGGCSNAGQTGAQGKGPSKASQVADAKKGEESKHSGWWCDEHGVPEAECSMCSPKVARDFKAKGDWCEKHDRAKSQCFLCDPSLKEKYAAQYRAKYGKEPPPTEDDQKDTKDGDKKPDEKK